MKPQKTIAVILHPIVIPTIGVLLYFLWIPHQIQKTQQLIILGLIFVATYLIPLCTLFVLKSLKRIHSFEVATIKERKIPLFLMILLFAVLGNNLANLSIFRDFSLLFYGATYALISVYFLFIVKLKTSLHLLAIGMLVGFFLALAAVYSISVLPIIIILILLSGLLASARLQVEAHSPKEIYTGFFIGVFSQIIVFLL